MTADCASASASRRGWTIPILNPELVKRACCFYGDWFALDLLLEIGAHHGTGAPLTRTCPGCGARVTVDWVTETAMFERTATATTTEDDHD